MNYRDSILKWELAPKQQTKNRKRMVDKCLVYRRQTDRQTDRKTDNVKYEYEPCFLCCDGKMNRLKGQFCEISSWPEKVPQTLHSNE